jgi:Competence protein CoiA-like family
VLIVGGAVVADLLVVGLDLVTGLEVHAEDRQTQEWRKKGHNGDQTLVCLACYRGADLPGGPQVVALVPKGRIGGARCRHFAHPPGMAPPGGRHNPESLDHSNGKQALRGWAANQGFAARVEVWTADGRRRSDVEVIMSGGVRVAIELQCSKIIDAEWAARHEDYVRAGITDLWLWDRRIEVPRVVFQYDQPGWRFDLETGELGLHYAHPDPAAVRAASEPRECGLVHSPPGPEDRLATLWMPLESARLTWHGIELPAEVTAELARLAEDAGRALAARRQAQEAAARQARADQAPVVARPSAVTNPDKYSQLVRVHEAFRYDAFPPWTDPDSWWYRCDVCGDKLTGAELKASPVIHVVCTYERADTGRYVEVYRRYGITTAEP